ncbi:MAG: PCYCGC motif-containing (lipo)protein [Candidatus Rokuibacteriota bacterium]
MRARDTRRPAPLITRRRLLYGAGAVGVAAIAAWQIWPSPVGSGTSVTTDAIGDQVQTLPRGQFPVFAGSGEIRDLYRYAVEHGDELQYMPCFCGCGHFGHQSNRDCYIKAFNTDGSLTFTSHAAT